MILFYFDRKILSIDKLFGRTTLKHITAQTIREIIQELGLLGMVPHPAYSKKPASSDHRLFRSTAHFLQVTNF